MIGFLGFSLLCALSGLLLRQVREEYAVFLRLAAVVAAAGAILSLLGSEWSVIGELLELLPEALYARIILKALGLAALCSLCAALCRAFGENTVADGVEQVGKIGILVLSLPLVREIFQTVRGLLS